MAGSTTPLRLPAKRTDRGGADRSTGGSGHHGDGWGRKGHTQLLVLGFTARETARLVLRQYPIGEKTVMEKCLCPGPKTSDAGVGVAMEFALWTKASNSLVNFAIFVQPSKRKLLVPTRGHACSGLFRCLKP